jgi:DNA-binding response OmpR family regulator
LIVQTVLVIEDDPDTRELYLECLESEGFAAICAEDGHVGIRKACQTAPDLVLCDIMMPTLDGYAVLKALRQQPTMANTPFIFLTAKVTADDRAYGLELGANHYLRKPCTAETLLNTVATWLTRQPHPASLAPSLLDCDSTIADTRPDNPSGQPADFFPDCPQLASVFEFIELNYGQPIGLTEIAQAVGYSPAYLTDLSRKKTGRTVYGWLIERRMMAARTLLLETDDAIEAIAHRVGYLNICNFFRQFRQHTGLTPKAWRERN